MPAFKFNARNLQHIWVPEQGCFVCVWTHDDGDLDRDKRLCYACVASLAGLNPTHGQFIVSSNPGGSNTYVYGIPTKIISVQGAIKVFIHDLTGALGYPRKTSVDASEKSIDGKALQAGTPFTGNTVEGHFPQGSSTDGQIVWRLKDLPSIHTAQGSVLEVTDYSRINSGANLSVPSGTLLVEYERDGAGRILTHPNGSPKFAKIDAAGGDVAQNFKIGYLGLQFVENYFGLGMHGWIGGGSTTSNPYPFQVSIVKTTQSLVTFKVAPGVVNSNILPAGVNTELSVGKTGTKYLKIFVFTNGRVATSAGIYNPDSTAIVTTGSVQKEGGPSQVEGYIGVFIEGDYFPLRYSNFTCSLTEAFKTQKTSNLDPWTEPFDRWYSWNLT